MSKITKKEYQKNSIFSNLIYIPDKNTYGAMLDAYKNLSVFEAINSNEPEWDPSW
jgi:hypothetical protein